MDTHVVKRTSIGGACTLDDVASEIGTSTLDELKVEELTSGPSVGVADEKQYILI